MMSWWAASKDSFSYLVFRGQCVPGVRACEGHDYIHLAATSLCHNSNSADACVSSVKQVVAALIVRDGKLLICQRTKDQPMALKWEFPGGKIEPGEEQVAALRRELDEELGISATIGEKVTSIQHHYKRGGAVELHFYRVREYKGEMENRIFEQIRWVDRRDLPRFDFLDADRDIIQQLANGKLLPN